MNFRIKHAEWIAAHPDRPFSIATLATTYASDVSSLHPTSPKEHVMKQYESDDGATLTTQLVDKMKWYGHAEDVDSTTVRVWGIGWERPVLYHLIEASES